MGASTLSSNAGLGSDVLVSTEITMSLGKGCSLFSSPMVAGNDMKPEKMSPSLVSEGRNCPAV